MEKNIFMDIDCKEILTELLFNVVKITAYTDHSNYINSAIPSSRKGVKIEVSIVVKLVGV